MSEAEKQAKGREEVMETRISDVRGEEGRLVLLGADIEELAGAVSFEELALRLFPRVDLARGRARAFAELAPSRGGGMDSLRAAIAGLASDEPELVIGAVAIAASGFQRPDPALGHAEDFLRMLRGRAPTQAEARALDAYFVTVLDHGTNASTFAARVIASTGSDLVSAVTGAIGALKGPLHGGAPGPVLDMLDAIGAPERAEAWIRAELAQQRRIMGMGHRIYRARDPARARGRQAGDHDRQARARARGGGCGRACPRGEAPRATAQVQRRVLHGDLARHGARPSRRPSRRRASSAGARTSPSSAQRAGSSGPPRATWESFREGAKSCREAP